MKILLHKLLPLIFLGIIFSNTSYGWNAMGHMIVANIAYQQLTPTAKNKVDQLVNVFQKEYPNFTSYTQIAYWPDALRSQQINIFARWHYIDVPFSNDGTDIANKKIDSDNAVWAVGQIKNILKSASVTPIEQARFLAFFTHIIGDLHQPLHTVSLYISDFPDGDRGGNLYTVKYQNQSTNLHSMWDEALGEFPASDSVEQASTLAQVIATKYPPSYFANRIQNFNSTDWTTEGMNNAKQYVYDTPINQALSADYVNAGKVIAEQQVALAGYRLGALLNQLLG